MRVRSIWRRTDIACANKRSTVVIVASLSESHTSVTALQNTCVCLLACLLACLWPYTVNLNSTNKYVYFKFAHVRAAALQKSNSMPMDLMNVTEDSSPCNSVPMNLY